MVGPLSNRGLGSSLTRTRTRQWYLWCRAVTTCDQTGGSGRPVCTHNLGSWENVCETLQNSATNETTSSLSRDCIPNKGIDDGHVRREQRHHALPDIA